MPERSELTKQSSSPNQDPHVLRHAAPQADHGRARPTPEQADRIIASKLTGKASSQQPMVDMGAVGPPRLDLGDQEIGSQTFHEAIMWNTETIEANVSGDGGLLGEILTI